MLVTKLKPGDILQVGDAQLLVGKITGSTVRLSIHAPPSIDIHRLQPLQSGEVVEAVASGDPTAHEAPTLLRVRRSRP